MPETVLAPVKNLTEPDRSGRPAYGLYQPRDRTRGVRRSPAVVERAMHLCATRRLDPLPLISHVLPAAAYALIDRPPADPLQVILDFTEDMR
jgi:threonine dehydrogenase-like Zn-dependent dehydrogenase